MIDLEKTAVQSLLEMFQKIGWGLLKQNIALNVEIANAEAGVSLLQREEVARFETSRTKKCHVH